jgi:glycerophosphoryl diester phosphodiesterase
MPELSAVDRPLLLGHRGARAVRSIAENTFDSFDRCMGDGCDGFEFDVRLSADGQAVVCHDAKSHRKEIAKVPAGQLPFLPRLEDVLKRYRDSAFLDIELKVTGLEKITVELLRAHPPRRGFVVSSFLPEVLRSVREADPAVSSGLICETRSQLREWTNLPIQYLIPHFRLIDAKLVAAVHAAGKKILVWTVNRERAMLRFRELGVDGMISDDPHLLKETIGSKWP